MDRTFCNLGRDGLTHTDIDAIAHGEPLHLDEAVNGRVVASHERLQRYVTEQRRIYGVTTGYGPLADTLVGHAHSEQLQRNLIAHLSAGVGEPLSRTQTRATMAARVAALAQGNSGVSPAALGLLVDCLNADALPVVPSMGTVGASGDLTPLAHIAGALMGHGRMRVQGGDPEPAGAALERLGLTPFNPEGKDAIALVNGTSAMTGIAALNGAACERALRWSSLLTAGHADVLGGRLEAWDPAFGALRPHNGQQRLHRWLRFLTRGSGWVTAPEHGETVAGNALERLDQPIQDPYTLRCAPQLLGAVSDQLAWHNSVVDTELNSVTDNPVLPDDADVALHGGNFYGQHVALASDALANAVITLAVHAERRIARLANVRLNHGLPAFLQARETGLHSGFMGAQVTASALLAEMRTHATPASIQSIPTNGDNQDVVTMGTIGARRCARLLDLLHHLLAIDALMVAQAVDLRWQMDQTATTTPSDAVQALHRWVRRIAPPLDADRALHDEIEMVAVRVALPGGLVEQLDAFAGPD
ncbi:histidine ammonia-lyase [Aquisalimonas sp.]|uniref:HAL/PAL/TAL family ammonia-lyase n=1 Tax=unclassified Aquisalimonas TaxID=2644645 RepID=UPI0025BE95E5|nr:aromatic amino acid ammonia-lyase [Aquisalimonas sp.]